MQHGVVRVGGEREDRGIAPVGQGEHEGAQVGAVGGGDWLVWWRGADAAPADGRGWERVEDAGEQAAAAEAGHGGDVSE